MRLTYALLAAFVTAAIGCPEESTQQNPMPAAPPPAANPASQPVAAANPEAAAGRKLYLTACANCHGPDGTGSMMRQALPTIGDLTSPEMHGRLSDADIAGIITNGRNNKMPAFGTMFSPEQQQQIIGYVRSMKRSQ